ncbi:unnamed protein product [Aphanomyces euteiches]
MWPLGTPEFAHCLATGDLLDLSEQQVVSCDNAQSHGCDGGFPGWAMDFERKGMCLESAYPYTSGQSDVTGTCQTTCEKKALSLGETVQDRGESALMTILNTQPVTVTVESGNPVWRNYEGGLVTQCPGAESDHAVIAVGYGTNSDGDYFKIKNSWGTWWGDNGYIYLQRGVGGKGMCNLADFIYYPDLKTAPTTNAPPPSTDDPTSVPTITPSPSTVPPTPTSSVPVPSTSAPIPPQPQPQHQRPQLHPKASLVCKANSYPKPTRSVLRTVSTRSLGTLRCRLNCKSLPTAALVTPRAVWLGGKTMGGINLVQAMLV